ncbi:MAG: ABC transporter ATP-binding protein [Desulfurococcales archaeon]|nr:ABC transporter ATP-binding protein [Desulfurococcales archaeon]
MPSRIVVEGISKRYKGAVAVDGLSLEIARGKVLGLLGPNGAGKTTTIKIILGLVKPDKGRVLLDDKDLHREGVRMKSLVGYTPEVPEGPAWATPCRLLEDLAVIDGVPRAEARLRARQALAELGVEDLCLRRMGKLSKGQKKRVLIAQALVAEREFMLMDEPFTGLDPEWVARVRELVLDLRRRGVGVLVSSHILRELQDLVDEVAVIAKGKTLFQGTIDELARKVAGGAVLLVRTPRPAEAARIVEEMGYRDVQVLAQAVRVRLESEDEAQAVISRLMERGVGVRGFETRGYDLEEAYLRLVGARR